MAGGGQPFLNHLQKGAHFRAFEKVGAGEIADDRTPRLQQHRAVVLLGVQHFDSVVVGNERVLVPLGDFSALAVGHVDYMWISNMQKPDASKNRQLPLFDEPNWPNGNPATIKQNLQSV